tara:strand:+ start:2873 stop:3343 length:471 start_codon:yes stop_codon:yes gene_type:complete
MNKPQLPMRNGVGIIVINKRKKVFVAKRKDNPIDKWQMPQGGVDLDEKYISAMRRELHEETSIQKIKVLKEIEGFFEYELPKNLIGKIWKGKYRGQRQKWFIVEFLGDDKEINLNTEKPEFIDWKWISPDDLPKVIVDFKRHIYLELLGYIKAFIK